MITVSWHLTSCSLSDIFYKFRCRSAILKTRTGGGKRNKCHFNKRNVQNTELIVGETERSRGRRHRWCHGAVAKCRSSSDSKFLIDRETEAPRATWCYGPGWKLPFQPRSQNCEKRLLASSRLFVHAHETARLPLERFSYIWVFFENVLRKFKFHPNRSRITGTLHEDQYTFMIISHSILIRMRNVSDKGYTETKTHSMFNSLLFCVCVVPFMR